MNNHTHDHAIVIRNTDNQRPKDKDRPQDINILLRSKRIDDRYDDRVFSDGLYTNRAPERAIYSYRHSDKMTISPIVEQYDTGFGVDKTLCEMIGVKHVKDNDQRINDGIPALNIKTNFKGIASSVDHSLSRLNQSLLGGAMPKSKFPALLKKAPQPEKIMKNKPNKKLFLSDLQKKDTSELSSDLDRIRRDRLARVNAAMGIYQS